MRHLTALLLAIVFGGVASAEPVTLATLESSLETAPEVEIAAAELEESLYLLQRERERRGLKLFASAGYADVTEPVTDELKRSYRRTTATVGLSYPLFGTKAREKMLVAEAEASVFESEQRAELSAMRSRSALRRSYVEYWLAHRRIEISQAFLEHEQQTRDWLTQRTSTGHLLEADRLEFLTAFDMSRRALASDVELRERSHRVLAMLTASPLSKFEPVAPELPQACLDPARLRAAVLDQHPELIALRSQMDTRLRLVDTNDDIEASINLTASVSEDHPSALSGDGLGVSFNMRMPFDFMDARRAGRGARSAAALRAQRQLELRSAQIANEADATVRRYQIAVENLSFAEGRLAASLESVRERQLRASELPGDVLEQLQQARFGYFRTALDLSDAEAQIIRAKIDVLALSDTTCDSMEIYDDLPGLKQVRIEPPIAPITNATPRGTYLWKSKGVVADRSQQQALWTNLKDKDITRVLMSLDGDQLRALRRSTAARRALREFLESAHARGFSVELLLGEPTWMLKEHRGELLDIIAQLELFAFNGLHLDLEPGMIDEEEHDRANVLAQLGHTVTAVMEASPWPVGMSLHFRDLDADRQGYCLGCVLSELELREVTLMIYVTNPNRVAEIAREVADNYPKLIFSVAQSVEPQLAADESHASRGSDELDRRLARLSDMLDPNRFSGILIQSWYDLEGLAQ